jgi:hypothetical protein
VMLGRHPLVLQPHDLLLGLLPVLCCHSGVLLPCEQLSPLLPRPRVVLPFAGLPDCPPHAPPCAAAVEPDCWRCHPKSALWPCVLGARRNDCRAAARYGAVQHVSSVDWGLAAFVAA